MKNRIIQYSKRIIGDHENKSIDVLDLFCGGGGAGIGISDYAHVTGIDKLELAGEYYPGRFIKADVFQLPIEFLQRFDFIWASPPCQEYSVVTKRWKAIDPIKYKHPDLVAKTRELLKASGVPYVIENVEGAPLNINLTLCGLMFGLNLYRHRIFESSFPILQLDHPKHEGQQPYSVYGNPQSAEMARSWPGQMGIYHIPPGSRLFAESIPPAFSRYIMRQFLAWRESNPIPAKKKAPIPDWLNQKMNPQGSLF